ncbi:biopolymer transporter ExbD [Ancylomarina euxinus]|uniref:Biopolymer transporter ExbD n=1 Tax=Ancylomarina euxinus TaxID=2283627 RepID=A0A425Y114_9BACT|nr:biopolymer transporter ExbD [Ancylomarina euxinus]MCZ4693767.1 biopolymer transporter ExbD [Ancylomarina euxinus]MUP15153.1 biopolymer transporter ExbD [Ancylomarina euxinus]RRG21576.1 biopolymer transporter ExbD [Ancylomarina euxinus]
MSKFRKDGKKELPAISTASLPDIVFMLLFFFMVATTMREVDLNVDIMVPEAKEITKLEKKDLVSNIYVGVPMRKFAKTYGSEPRIQLNDQFATVDDIQAFISTERESRKEELRNKLTTSLKVDQYTKMGIITDIKQELRKASSLKLNYSTRQTAE